MPIPPILKGIEKSNWSCWDIECIVESCHSILTQPQAATNVSDRFFKCHGVSMHNS